MYHFYLPGVSVFPAGVITREIKVGPAFDLVSGAPYSIRVMVAPSRSLVWAETGDPVVAKLKTYVVEPGSSSLIPLPVTDQDGYETGRGEAIELGADEHAFGYKISVFYLVNGSVARKTPPATVILPTGTGPVDVDDLVSFTSGNSGSVISAPDSWTAKVVAAQAAAEASAASAAEALGAIEELESNIGTAVDEWFDENAETIVSPESLEAAITAHKNEEEPHKAYDLDIPSLTVLFENGLV